MRILLSDGSSPYVYKVDNPSGTSTDQKLTRMALFETVGNEYFIGCAENLGANKNDIALIYYTNLIGLIPTLNKVWSYTPTGTMTCLDIQIDASKSYFILNS